MARLSRKKRTRAAFFIWLAGLLLAAGVGWQFYHINSEDADSRLIGEAARSAGELAALLTYSENQDDPEFARAIATGALEDERIYAVKITVNDYVKEGLRRNYLWEPIPWDNEITETSMQGMYPIKNFGKSIGRVEVWISTRAVNEEKALFFSRELMRFGIFFLLWSCAFFLLLWQWGDIRRWIARLKSDPAELQGAEKIILQLSREQREEAERITQENKPPAERDAVNANAGRLHQRSDPDSWFVTAGMFYQTFARAPNLMNRLYADGETAGLCHLGRMLEQAAPCIGADRLRQTSKEMQRKLNNPNAPDEASAVEECVAALEAVLKELGGKEQWLCKSEDARSS